MPRIHHLCAALLVVGGLSVAPGIVRAAESYDNCTGFIDSLPAVIATQGTWCLRGNLSTAITDGDAITVATNNVTIDCNDFKLGGLAAGLGTLANGVRANNRFNAVIRNCNIRGFRIAIVVTGGGGHLIEHNSFDSNTYAGPYAISPGSTIRDNLVMDTGGSTAVTSEAYGILAMSGVDVIDNTINGVAAAGANASAYGIYTNGNSEGSVVANRIRGLASAGSGTVFGIYNDASGLTVLRDNDVQGNVSEVVGSLGIRCTNNQATARDNVIAGFETGTLDCLSSGNTINSN